MILIVNHACGNADHGCGNAALRRCRFQMHCRSLAQACSRPVRDQQRLALHASSPLLALDAIVASTQMSTCWCISNWILILFSFSDFELDYNLVIIIDITIDIDIDWYRFDVDEDY